MEKASDGALIIWDSNHRLGKSATESLASTMVAGLQIQCSRAENSSLNEQCEGANSMFVRRVADEGMKFVVIAGIRKLSRVKDITQPVPLTSSLQCMIDFESS